MFLHSFSNPCVPSKFVRTASFKDSFILTDAAQWNTTDTFSSSTVVSAGERSKPGLQRSDLIGITFFNDSGLLLLIVSNSWKEEKLIENTV